MKRIVFFGDSFASFGRGCQGFGQQNSQEKNLVSYLDLVSDSLNAEPVYLGFGGTSWWFSYVRLMDWVKNNPGQWQEVEYIVMCLTGSDRPKISREDHILNLRKHTPELYMMDEFNQWAYRKFLHEFSQRSRNKKVIVLPCFKPEIWISEEYRTLWATCALELCTVSQSEFDISTRSRNPMHELMARTEVDNRANHLNEHNNRALAADLVAKFVNYQPGIFMLDESKYFRANQILEPHYQQARERFERYSSSIINENVL